MQLTKIFEPENTKSKGFSSYDNGKIPFITNGFTDNGFLGYVKPNKNDHVIMKDSICISAFCEATVQKAPYLPRGNGGSGLMVLTPKKEMSFDEMLFHASYINQVYRPKFFYGRMVSKDRLERFTLKKYDLLKDRFSISSLDSLVPKALTSKISLKQNLKLENISLKELTSEITMGDYHVSSDLEHGNIPFVSCSTINNGISTYVDTEKTYDNCITIASDGMTPSTAFYQPEKFNAQDNVIICKLKNKLKLYTIFFILHQINRLNWRFSYGRKCYQNKIDKISVNLPVTETKEIDECFIESIVKNCYGWDLVSKNFSKT